MSYFAAQGVREMSKKDVHTTDFGETDVGSRLFFNGDQLTSMGTNNTKIGKQKHHKGTAKHSKVVNR